MTIELFIAIQVLCITCVAMGYDWGRNARLDD